MPIDVRMPDGTLVKNVPDNITQADLLARYNAFTAQPATPVAPPSVGPEGAPIPSILQNKEPPVPEQTLLQKLVGVEPTRGPKGPGARELASDIYQAAKQFPEQLASSAIQAYQGKDAEAIAQDSTANKIVDDARKSAEANLAMKGGEDTYTDFLGAKIKRSDIRNLPQNLSFSLVAMGSALLSGLGTTIASAPVAGPAAPLVGTGAGAAAAGKVAYNIDTNSFLRDFREGLNQASIEQRGIPITNEEFVKIAQSPEMQAKAKEFNLDVRGKGAVDELAKIHGLHEAGWEAISSTVGLGAGKYIFKEALKGKVLKPVAAFTGELGLELAGETATQLGQSNVERKAGMHQDAERSWSSAADWKKSYEEVAGPTVLTTALLGGVPAIAGAGKRAIQKATQPPVQQERVEPEVTPPEVSETPAPVETVTSDKVLSLAQKRLNEIETKMNGTPDYEGVGPDGKPRIVKGELPQLINDQERAEYDFLKNNISDPNAIAKTYGLTIEDKAGLPAKEVTEAKTSHNTQAMLDELSGKEIEYTPEEEQKTPSTSTQIPKSELPIGSKVSWNDDGNQVQSTILDTMSKAGITMYKVTSTDPARPNGVWVESSNLEPVQEQPSEEPTGVISETEKEFVPVGGRLINKKDADKLARESAIALQQNLATQEAEKEKQLKQEIREEKFREPPTQTLSARLVQEGGISREQKRDMLGETGKVENYDHVFRAKGNDLLTLVKDGKLDDYLPPDLRTTATAPNDLYDARPGYNYISDMIKTGEKVHTYEYEMAKLEHENMVYEKNLAKQQMTPNEAARAAAAEEQGKVFLSQGKIEGGSTPDVITQSVKSELGKEGSKLLDNEKIIIVKDINDLKEKNYLGDRIGQLTDNTRALYDPVTDRSYFIADRMKPSEVRAMAMHEVGTHYGMNKMLGDTAYKTVLNNVKRLSTTDRAVRAAYNETLKSYSNLLETNTNAFYEEVLAHLGETAPNHSLWKQILQKVKTFLIKAGIVKNISASELQDLVMASLRRASQEAKSETIRTSERVAESQIPRNIKGQEVLPQWHGPEESKIDTWIYRLQNKQIDTKRVQELIGDIEEDWNVYEKEQLYHGRTAAGIRNFLLKELLPVIKDIERLKIKPEDVRTYLHNRHAEERNNQMNKINPDIYDEKTGKTIPNPLKDKGSGISTADAKAYLEGLDPARKQVLEQIATKFDQMIKGTQQILINSGAESADTIAKWNSTYEHYVPLFRVEDEMARPTGMGGTGQGFGVRGAFSKRAMGSEKDVQDILSNIIAQRERALIRAEKIRVGRALYGLAIQNPNPDFWLPINPDAIRNKKQAIAELRRMGVPDAEQMIENLMAEPKERYLKKTRAAEEGFEPDEDFDFDSGLPVNESKEVVASKINVMARYKDFVFPVRINGKDRYIFFNKNDPRAFRMVQSLKNLDVEQLGYLENIFGKFTRWFKNVNTQYNPVFGLVNFLRDMSGTFLNLTNTEIKGKQAQVIAGAYKAMGGILNVHRAERKGKPLPTGPWAKLYQEARDEGFQTGYRDSLIRNQEEMQIVETTLSQFKDGNTKKAFYAVLGALTDYNDMMENAFRLSAYKVALDQGLSKQKAAIIAKNLTVNFDKKGAWTSQVNALYAFFNASVQGTERIYQTLKGPKGKLIIGGGILAGMVQAVMLASAGYGDDDPPEFVRERNFIVPLADGTYMTIPYPLGYNLLPNSGRITMDFMIRGGRDAGKHMTSLMSALMNSLNPLGSSGFALQTMMPTAIDPVVAIAENKDSFGRPIYRPDRSTAPTPGYTRSRDTASTLGKGIAEFLNWASGGTKYQKGSISPTGDEVDFLAGQIGGGLYREISKTVKAIGSQSTGEALAPYQRPIVSRFYGETGSPAAVSQTFYNNVTRMTDHENEIKGRMKNRENVEEYLRDNPDARLWKRANTIENKVNELNKRKRMFIDRGFPKERIQAIDAQKTMLMQRFNDQVSNLTPE